MQASRTSRQRRNHLIQVAEALQLQHKHRQRLDVFSKWKLFVVMKAVGTLVQSAAFLSPAQLQSTSTNGGGPLPLTLLIKAGKRATIKKRVVSTTRIYRSSISGPADIGGSGPTSTTSPALGQLAQSLQFTASPTSAIPSTSKYFVPSISSSSTHPVDSLLVPNCMKPGAALGSPAQPPTPPTATSPRASRTSPTHDLSSTPTTASAVDGLADFLNGIGSCGAINSPVMPSDMSYQSLVKEVQLMRATIEAQKRTIDMRDRYINELVRRQDTELSMRDIERDHVLQLAVSKLESNKQQQRSRAGSKVGGLGVTIAAAGLSTSPSSVPLVPFHQPQPPPLGSSQTTQTSPVDAANSTASDGSGSAFESKSVPMPPPVASPSVDGTSSMASSAPNSIRLSGRNQTSGGPQHNLLRSNSNLTQLNNANKKRNSVDNANLSNTVPTPSTTPRDGIVDEKNAGAATSAAVATVVASVAKVTAQQQKSHALSSSASMKKVDAAHNSTPAPVVVLAAQPQMVSLSISSMMRPAGPMPTSHSHHQLTDAHQQPATDFVLLSARGTQGHGQAGSGGSSSQPTSSRKVHALRGTSLLPILSQQQQQQQMQVSGVAGAGAVAAKQQPSVSTAAGSGVASGK